MESLYWDWRRFDKPAAAEGVDGVLAAIAEKLPGLGYTNVAVAQDVHGFKCELLLAAIFPHINASSYWQVIAVGGTGSSSAAHAEIKDVTNVIKNLGFV